MTADLGDRVPALRGVLHAYAVWVAFVASVVLVGLADGATARVSAAVYGAGLTGLFAASAAYHRWRWDPALRPIARRVDHSAIFVFIAASYTPVALLVLDGAMRWIIFGTVWGGALAGVLLSVAWVTAWRWLRAATTVLLGWVAVAAMPDLVDRLPPAPLVLFALGGVLYTIGAAVYAAQRPDPWPRTFGFHEIFHALVVVAAVTHFAAMAGWVVPL